MPSFPSLPSLLSLHFRWLGVGGIELTTGDQVLTIDPYLTRVPFWRMGFGRVRPNRELIAAKIPRCDFVLVTHAHVDHVMDVPAVVHNTDAVTLGSANACRLLAVSGVPAGRLREIGVGDTFTLGKFQVEVLPADHVKFPGWRLFSGPLPSDLRPPLRVRDCRMDSCFGFLIQVDGCRLLHCPGPAVSADALTVKPLGTYPDYEALLRGVRPRIVIPIHWDDLGRPLSRPIRPMIAPSGRLLPPLKRLDLAQFRRMIEQIAPATQVLLPEIFHVYDL